MAKVTNGSAVLSPSMLEIWPHLNHQQRLLLPVALSYSPNIFADHTTMANRIGRSRQAVQSIMDSLARVGFWNVTRRYREDGGRSSNVYTVSDLDNPTVRQAIINALCPPQNMTGGKHDRGEIVQGGASAGATPPCQCAPDSSNIQVRSIPTGTNKEVAADAAPAASGGHLPGDREASGPPASNPPSPQSFGPLESASSSSETFGAQPGTVRAAASSPPPMASKRAGTRRAWMSPEQMAWCLASPENVDLYLRFGADAFGRARLECEGGALASMPEDWLAFGPDDEVHPFSNDWGASHHAGYYWHGVCRWRANAGINLTLPQWRRLDEEIRKLLTTMTSWQVHLYIFNLVNYFELVQFRIGNLGKSLVLDETTLGHALVRQELLAFGDGDWVAAEYARMAEVKESLESREYAKV